MTSTQLLNKAGYKEVIGDKKDETEFYLNKTTKDEYEIIMFSDKVKMVFLSSILNGKQIPFVLSELELLAINRKFEEKGWNK